MNKYIIPLLFIVVVCSGLWFTRPAAVMPHCVANNPEFSCQFLDKE